MTRSAPTCPVSLVHVPLRPFGRVVETTGPARLSDLSSERLAAWTVESRVLVLRGFDTLGSDEFADWCRDWGRVLVWPVGEVVDLVVQDDPANYLFASGDVPFHWDGAFVEDDPRWFFFQCLDATPGAGGETVFSDTTAVYRDADPSTRARWADVRITYRTETLAHYGGEVTADLVSEHPVTGLPVLRFAEPLDPEIYRNPVSADVEGMTSEQSAEFLGDLADRVHRPEYCYHHDWRAGDVVIADNVALIHGRTAFSGPTNRHLQRVEVI